MEISLRKNKQVCTAVAIAGRSCRPCDGCGRHQARWFCAADEAYLCAKCDGSVHGANAVASKHERSPLGPAGLPTLKLPSAMESSYCNRSKKSRESGSSSLAFGLPKKPRSVRHHQHMSTDQFTSATNSCAEDRIKPTNSVLGVKNEPDSPDAISPAVASLDLDHHDFSAHEVPIFLPSEQELLLPLPSVSSHPPININEISRDRIPKEEAEFAIKEFLESRMEQRSRNQDQEMEMNMSTAEDELSIVDEMGLFGICDENLVINADYIEYGIDFSCIEAFQADCRNASEGEVPEEGTEGNDERTMCWSRLVKMEDSHDEAQKIKSEVDELLACALITGLKEELATDDEIDQLVDHEESATVRKGTSLMESRKVSLKLDYDDVLSAWSDRGSLWTDGRRPQVVPEECEYDNVRILEKIGQQLVPDLNFDCFSDMTGASIQLRYGGGYHNSDIQQAAVGLVPVAANNNLLGDDIEQVNIIDMSTSGNTGNSLSEVYNMSGGREARVMRYREKRRTRLFSKKIRYEVRKLNAEMRPRWKGRFVKRSAASVALS